MNTNATRGIWDISAVLPGFAYKGHRVKPQRTSGSRMVGTKGVMRFRILGLRDLQCRTRSHACHRQEVVSTPKKGF